MSRPRSAVLLLVLHVSACTGWQTRDVAPEALVSKSQPVAKTALLVSGVGLVALVLLAKTVGVQGATPNY